MTVCVDHECVQARSTTGPMWANTQPGGGVMSRVLSSLKAEAAARPMPRNSKFLTSPAVLDVVLQEQLLSAVWLGSAGRCQAPRL